MPSYLVSQSYSGVSPMLIPPNTDVSLWAPVICLTALITHFLSSLWDSLSGESGDLGVALNCPLPFSFLGVGLQAPVDLGWTDQGPPSDNIVLVTCLEGTKGSSSGWCGDHRTACLFLNSRACSASCINSFIRALV